MAAHGKVQAGLPKCGLIRTRTPYTYGFLGTCQDGSRSHMETDHEEVWILQEHESTPRRLFSGRSGVGSKIGNVDTDTWNHVFRLIGTARHWLSNIRGAGSSADRQRSASAHAGGYCQPSECQWNPMAPPRLGSVTMVDDDSDNEEDYALPAPTANKGKGRAHATNKASTGTRRFQESHYKRRGPKAEAPENHAFEKLRPNRRRWRWNASRCCTCTDETPVATVARGKLGVPGLPQSYDGRAAKSVTVGVDSYFPTLSSPLRRAPSAIYEIFVVIRGYLENADVNVADVCNSGTERNVRCGTDVLIGSYFDRELCANGWLHPPNISADGCRSHWGLFLAGWSHSSAHRKSATWWR
ncbi:hypothetical protein B0H11DRAFT_1902419 [Mycena galericulata]|nr:hypothetical protein B0H11DRAFT_1902419 [Mycena galericulata]